MRSRTKKAIITALCCSMLAGGTLAVILANAEPNNWLAIQYEQKKTTAFCGETVSVDDVLPVYPDKVEKILYEVTAPDGSHVSLSNGDFIVEQEGEYDVIISLLGYDDSSYSESYSISATKSSAPILVQAPVVPLAFLERYNPDVTNASSIKTSYKYTAPEAVFVDYNTQTPTVVDYSVYLTDKYGKDVLITDTFSPVVDVHQDKATLKYVATSSVTNEQCTVEYHVPVLKASQRNQDGKFVYEYDKLFVTSGGVSTSKVTERGATFTGTGDYSITYFNKLKSNFSVLLMSDTVVKFVSATVRVSDIKNPDEVVTIEILKDLGGSSTVSVNGEAAVTAQGSLTNENGLALTFDEKFSTIVDGTNTTVSKLTTNVKGRPFSGFSSGYVNVSIEVNGGTSDSTISILSINGQKMINTGKDTDNQDKIFPSCETKQEMRRRYNIGETIKIFEADSYDIIDPNLASTVTVRSPEGTIVTSVDNVRLEKVDASRAYEIVLNSLGNYMVSYNTQDISENGKKQDRIYTIYVLDGVSPTINVPNLSQSNVAKGASLTVPEIEVSDNITKNENLVILITISLPDNTYQVVTSGTQFVFSIPGTYTIRYTVIDEAFNLASFDQNITCWEA